MNSILFSIILLSAGSQAPTELPADSRLQARVEVVSTCVTLAELLRQISHQAGVPLKVATELEETLVVVRWGGEARGLLQLLGDYFQWTWEPDGAGYRLERTSRRREVEEEMWRRERLDAFDSAREALAAEISQASQPLSDEEQKKIQEIRRAMAALRNRPEGQTDWEAHYKLSIELQNLLKKADLARTLAMLAFVEAPEEARLRLVAGQAVTFADKPSPRQFPLGPRGRELAQRLVQEYSQLSKLSEEKHAELGPEVMRDIRTPFEPSNVKQVVVQSSASSGFPGFLFPLDSRVIVASFDDRALVSASVDTSLAAVKPKWSNQIARPTTDWSQIPVDPAEFRRAIEAGKEERKREPCAPFARMLLFLAERADRDLIAEASDAYLAPRFYEAVEGRTVGELFTHLSRMFHLEAEDHEGTIVVRQRASPMWARRLTIPRSLLRPLLAEMDSTWGLPLDRMASVAASLTDEQFDRWTQTLEAALDIAPSHATVVTVEARDHLRLWASLPPTVRERLLAGETLGYGELPVQARAVILRLADQLSSSSSALFSTASLPPVAREPWGETVDAGLRGLLGSRLVMNTTVRHPRDLPNETRIRVVRTEAPAVGYERQSEGRAIKIISLAWDVGRSDASNAEAMRAPNEGLYVGLEEIQSLGILLPDGTAILCNVRSRRLTEGARPLKRGQLPEPVRRAIEEGRQAGGGTLDNAAKTGML